MITFNVSESTKQENQEHLGKDIKKNRYLGLNKTQNLIEP